MSEVIPLPRGATMTVDANGVMSVTGVPPGWTPSAFSFSRQIKSDHRVRDSWLSVARRWLG